jgi:hypothetical protein
MEISHKQFYIYYLQSHYHIILITFISMIGHIDNIHMTIYG